MNKLKWHLLTSESVTTAEEAEKIIFYYEKRWLIEDYHKVWKSEGTDVESLRMQTKENLERMHRLVLKKIFNPHLSKVTSNLRLLCLF